MSVNIALVLVSINAFFFLIIYIEKLTFKLTLLNFFFYPHSAVLALIQSIRWRETNDSHVARVSAAASIVSRPMDTALVVWLLIQLKTM